MTSPAEIPEAYSWLFAAPTSTEIIAIQTVLDALARRIGYEANREKQAVGLNHSSTN